LDTNIHHKKSKNGSIFEIIYIPKAALDEIKPSIIPHIHDSMLYKIQPGGGGGGSVLNKIQKVSKAIKNLKWKLILLILSFSPQIRITFVSLY
jgi:hypothetical protein